MYIYIPTLKYLARYTQSFNSIFVFNSSLGWDLADPHVHLPFQLHRTK